MSKSYVYRDKTIARLISLYDTFGYAFAQKKAPKVSQPPQHICLVILHQIGDMIMAMPTIAAVRQMFPEAKLTIIAGKGPSQLLKDNPYHADVIPFDALWQHVVRHLGGHEKDKAAITNAKAQFVALINKLNPDTVLVFHPDLRVNQLLGQTKVPHTIGFINAGGGFKLTHPLAMPEHGHQVERNFALVHKLAKIYNVPAPEVAPPHFTPHKDDVLFIEQLMHETKLKSGKFAVLHPFGSAKTKSWLPESWAQTIVWLHEQNLTPVIIGGPNDALDLPEVRDHALVLCGKINLLQTAALLQKAALFIGVDSGPGHIAAAVGTPVISVFSSVNDVTRWHPYGDKAKTIILHKPVTDRTKYPYELRELPEGTIGNPYIDKITVAMVIEAAKKLLK